MTENKQRLIQKSQLLLLEEASYERLHIEAERQRKEVLIPLRAEVELLEIKVLNEIKNK